jgi:abortive infection bacteriophage resistance protein
MGIFFMKYNKPAKSLPKQIQLLRERDLLITNEDFTINILKNVNYYRISAYFSPFQKIKDKFIPDTTFDNIFNLYKFDRNLRILFFDFLEIIEISIRTKVAYYLANKYDKFGYIRKDIYNQFFKYEEWFSKLEINIKKSQEIFVKHYKTKYTKEKYLPIWMMVEIISFGSLSVFYNHLKNADKQKISRDNYGVDKKILSSWLHSLVYIRNLCAHHSRLWNRILSISPKKPKKEDIWKNFPGNKIFTILLIFKRLSPDQNYWNHWKNKLYTLINKYKEAKIGSMGFPENWKKIL